MYRSRWESSNKALLEMAEEVRRLQLACSLPVVLGALWPVVSAEVGGRAGSQQQLASVGAQEENSRDGSVRFGVVLAVLGFISWI